MSYDPSAGAELFSGGFSYSSGFTRGVRQDSLNPVIRR
jgi:hypothetical protein